MSLNVSHMRNLAAPFQPTGPMSPRGALEAFQIDENHLKSTYVAVSFPELEDVERLHFDKVYALVTIFYYYNFLTVLWSYS